MNRLLCAIAGVLFCGHASAQVLYGPAAIHGGTIDGATITNSTISGANTSGANVTATGGTTARTLADRALDTVNALDFGADPTGVTDSSPYINAAAAVVRSGSLADVALPAGKYKVKSPILLGSATKSQCLVGVGGGTILYVDSDFSTSASGVVVFATGNGASGVEPCVRNIQFVFAQPNDVITTTTATTAVGGNTITLASVSGISVGMSVVDTTASTAIPTPVYGSSTTVPTVSSIAGNVITLSVNVAGSGVGSGDTIQFGTTRARFATLAAGCTTSTGGTGCKYPWAIYNNGATSAYIDHVTITGAWNGVYQRGQTFHIGTLFVGAYNIGLDVDNCHNFPQIDDYEFWLFGNNSAQTALSSVYYDGATVAANLGAMDGGAIGKLQSWDGLVNVTANWSWGSIDTLMLDGSQASLNVLSTSSTGRLQISKMYSTKGGAANQAAVYSNANASFYTDIANVYMTSQYASGFNIDLEGGVLSIDGGYLYKNAAGANAFVKQGGGSLSISNTHLNGNSGSAGTYVSQSAGSIRFVNNTFDSAAGTTSAASLTDNALNEVSQNTFNGWAFQAPGALGNYNPNAGNAQGGWIAYTPTVFAWHTGTMGAYTATGSYRREGMQTCVNINATLTSIGTADSIRVSLPLGSVIASYMTGVTSSGIVAAQVVASGSFTFLINTAGVSWVPANGNLVTVVGCYQSN